MDWDMVRNWTILIVSVAWLAATIVGQLVRVRRKTKRILKEWDTSPEEPPLKEYRVVILEKQCYTQESGIKTPRHHCRFGIKVLMDNGEERWFGVDEDVYHTVEEDAVGTLALVGDRVYGFCEEKW